MNNASGEDPDEGELVIREITPELVGDYLHFFDHVAFTDNPGWGSCYCYCYLGAFGGEEWNARTAEQNRSDVNAVICRGEMKGLLAYLGGKVVAWCHAAPRLCLPAIANDPDLPSGNLEVTGSIVCFLVAPEYRRRGIARTLLSGACDYFARLGMHYVEAYPRSGETRSTANYHGPEEMYRAAGFSVAGEFPGGMVVRKRLEAEPPQATT
ncbi:MAG TPA: GNAT family N-acetyltransferase [Candidatus Kapabacteria bacterium]|nr:GNAT family N-acetyltransferase [Candidatus Kapabacteria bacterium]